MSRLFYHVMQDNLGNLMFGVTGTMRLAGTSTIASIFGDEAMTVVLPNPMTNHPSFGSFRCFLPSGVYDFYMAKPGYTFETMTGVQGTGTMTYQNANAVQITGGTLDSCALVGGTATAVAISGGTMDGTALNACAIAFGTTNSTAITGGTATAVAISSGTMDGTALNACAIAGGTINSAAITGGTASTVAISGGTITGAAISGGTLSTTTISGTVANLSSLDVTGICRFMSQIVVGAGALPLAGANHTAFFTRSGNFGTVYKPTDADTGTAQPILFHTTGGAAVGGIATNATTTTYNTTSDARLKEDVAPLTGALDVMRALNPVAFRWKADATPGHGFLAHEVAGVVDGVITGEKDAVDAAGNVQPQMIDYSKLVPYLIGAVKELTQQVEMLTAKLAGA